jgi:hypothetical protein
LGRAAVSIPLASWDGCIDHPVAFAGTAGTVKVSVAAGARVGCRDGPSRQTTGPAWPGASQNPFPARRWTHRPGTARTAAVSPRQSAAKPFNLPHNVKESELHVSVAELLDWILLPPAMFTTFPAGWGKLTKATAGRLYASGLKKGMPDILVFEKAGIGTTKVIGIELKVDGGSVSSAQRTMFAKLQAVSIRVYICRNIEDVVRALADAGIPYRKTDLERKLEMAGQLDMSL